MTATLRYEADVDLPTLAAEAGLKPEEMLPRIDRFGDAVEELRAR